jgi:hypothetical protein
MRNVPLIAPSLRGRMRSVSNPRMKKLRSVKSRLVCILKLGVLAAGFWTLSIAHGSDAAQGEDFLRANMDMSVEPGVDFIADYGGLLLGLEAFKKTDQFKKGEKIGGLTPLQRYFLGYALGWLHQEQEARLRRNLLSDVHSPAKWCVLGPLANIPEFHEAFGVKTNQPMWRHRKHR